MQVEEKITSTYCWTFTGTEPKTRRKKAIYAHPVIYCNFFICSIQAYFTNRITLLRMPIPKRCYRMCLRPVCFVIFFFYFLDIEYLLVSCFRVQGKFRTGFLRAPGEREEVFGRAETILYCFFCSLSAKYSLTIFRSEVGESILPTADTNYICDALRHFVKQRSAFSVKQSPRRVNSIYLSKRI